ncbi:GPO family capsid scaffolding protein [Pseudoalteromonas sp. MMG013]|uniref:GPO family capsid scaffolding protein n=1 Tax=Pseudoalteromonas sp. MMG013 TaxID=2822687 RepID=UPI001B375EBA|nr:GPO family capsid scaffolding protein [Pseudoalteromonas sp. MMG013]MBQ4864617.1 GPO family capsid scaffolding protein [Pseudoalteromonas sp. MMG013]
MSKKVSKFFRVFTEGDTTDGRVVERGWIEDMAATYNTANYGARIWLEHIRSVLPDSPFKAYGDVLAVKAEEVEGGKLALFAQIDPTPDLIAMNKSRQKIYTSVEIDPDFAKSGKCYLAGLAVTDSPASLGTEMLEFSATAKTNPLADRKQKPDNLFTAAVAIELEFEDSTEHKENGLFSKVSSLLNKNKKHNDGNFGDINQAVETIAQSFSQFEANTQKQLETTTNHYNDLSEKHNQLQNAFDTLKEQLSNEESGGQGRAPATGGNGQVQTDC